MYFPKLTKSGSFHSSRRSFLMAGTAGLAAASPLIAQTENEPGVGGLPEKLKGVNYTDIRSAIEMGCTSMSSVFNKDDHDIPFFASEVWPHAQLRWNPNHSESHVPGRHLNALLTAEATIGLKVSDEVITKGEYAAFFSYSGALPLPLNRETINGKPVRFLPHNLREGFHALYALVRYRNSSKAKELAEKSIDTINRLWNPDKGWNKIEIERRGVTLLEWNSPFITGIARSIGPLVKYYRATKYSPALQLASALKEKALTHFFNEDGHYNTEEFGTHVHSTTCVMSSLAQLADLMQDAFLMNRVKVFYDHGLKAISDDNGWSIENSGPSANPDRGEANNTGDILETSLILGKWGYPGSYEKAERILRSHLLPCQLRDVSFIKDPSNPQDEDGKRKVAERHRGAFGFPAPYGHMPVSVKNISFNMDIVGGAVGSLCEAFKQCITTGEAGPRVNLLFDHETESALVRSPYTHGILEVQSKKQGALSVRLPSWTDRQTVEITGAPSKPWFEGEYMFLPGLAPGTKVVIRFELARRDTILQHRTRKIKVRMQGDRVLAMDHFRQPLCYFDPLDL